MRTLPRPPITTRSAARRVARAGTRRTAPTTVRVVAAASLLLGGSGLLTACADADQRPASGSTGPRASDRPGSDADPGAPASPTEDSSEPAETATVPVYFVGDTPSGPRLFREFRRVPATGPLWEALSLAASGDALDPDYRTLLPAGSFETSDASADGPWIDLPDDSWTQRPDGMSDAEALLAVQQLVYTAQGVLQSRDPVHFTDSSGAETQVLGIASEDGFTAADPMRTLALMSITGPEEGQQVSGSFTASGVGSSFEANVPWEIRDSSGAVVLHGATTAEGWMDKLYPWQAEVDVSSLSPGTYTFIARTDDPSDGEGAGPTQDTRTIEVG